MTLLSVGEKYPDPLPVTEGAISEFLRQGGNRLIIAIPDISDEEARALRRGDMRGGLLSAGGAILFIWQFNDKRGPIFTLDSPFDARKIPDIQLYDIENAQQRVVIEVIAVDSASMQVRGIRSITMPPGMTVEFLSAVQDQMGTGQLGDEQQQRWQFQEPERLAKQTTMWRMGT